MKIVIQKVKHCRVTVNSIAIAEIARGIVIYVGIEINEPENNINWLLTQISEKIKNESKNEILILSQFTLLGKFKGNKPSFHLAETNFKAFDYFNKAVSVAKEHFPGRVQNGKFGKKLEIELDFDQINCECLETDLETCDSVC